MRVNRFSLVMGAAFLYTCLRSVNGQTQESTGKERCASSCVPYFLCVNGTVSSNTAVDSSGGTGNDLDMSIAAMMDKRIGEADSVGEGFGEGGCNHYLEKCCEIAAGPSRRNICGNRQVNGVNRITGLSDNEAEYGEFPWMVALLNQDKTAGSATNGNQVGQALLECGGSIIHSQVILTAAHCVNNNKVLTVRAGEWDTQNKERIPIQERNVKQVIIHESFYAPGLLNDIALLVLDSPLELTEVVGTICLPDQDEVMDNRNCVVTGWGKDQFGKNGSYQVILKKIEVPVVPRDPCLKTFQSTQLGQYFTLDESFICAGGEAGRDSCQGDGGGPLACPSKSNSKVYVQAGIVSWGLSCGGTEPAAYVNVPRFIGWINSKLDSLNFV